MTAALALIAVPGALADGAYSDPAGDSGVAPDISAVAVTHDDATVTLVVTTNQSNLASDASFFGYLDTDENASTGLRYRGIGADHFFLGDAEGGIIAHVVDNRLMFDFDSGFSASYGAGRFTARIDRSDFSAAEGFVLLIESEQDDANGETIGADLAPDAPPYYRYSFVEEALAVTVGRPAGVPPKPIAGKSFAVVVPVTRSDEEPFTAGRVACKARLGKAALRSAGRVAGGSARCSMRIPKTARGKTLKGSITVMVETAPAVTRAFAFRVR